MEERRDPQIPIVLHSSYAAKPFSHCIECTSELLDSGVAYAVEKVKKDGEVVFEYAICASCLMALFKQYSQESVARIREYMEKEDVDRELFVDQVFWAAGCTLDHDTDEILRSAPLDSCQRCGSQGGEFEEEHTVMGLFVGRQLATAVNTICGRCTEGIEDLLSEATRDIHDDFIQRNFPGVPAGLDLPMGVMGI